MTPDHIRSRREIQTEYYDEVLRDVGVDSTADAQSLMDESAADDHAHQLLQQAMDQTNQFLERLDDAPLCCDHPMASEILDGENGSLYVCHVCHFCGREVL